MRSLAAPTDPAWTASAVADIDAVLLDHAHCEKKAAGMAVRLLFKYPEHSFLQEPLSRLAREELQHFEQVLAHLARRKVAFRRQHAAPYAGRLRGDIRAREPERLLDTLLCAALIEARSCERFLLLADAVGDPELAALYRGLVAAEARHHRIYVDLAEQLAASEVVGARLAELSDREARILAGGPGPPRMHS